MCVYIYMVLNAFFQDSDLTHSLATVVKPDYCE